LPEAITGENVYVTDRIRVGNDEHLQESRMREIRKSGLTRGSSGIGVSRPLLSTLLVQKQSNQPQKAQKAQK
jgi:hypothetical protein